MYCRKQQSRASFSSHEAAEQGEQVRRPSRGASITSLGQVVAQVASSTGNLPPPMGPPPQAPMANAIPNRRSSKEAPIDSVPIIPARPPFNETNPFATAEPFPDMTQNSGPPNQDRPALTKRDSQTTVEEIKDEVDDTMRNLRKTFAGIFGDM